jgi:hypothetical protein
MTERRTPSENEGGRLTRRAFVERGSASLGFLALGASPQAWELLRRPITRGGRAREVHFYSPGQVHSMVRAPSEWSGSW